MDKNEEQIKKSAVCVNVYFGKLEYVVDFLEKELLNEHNVYVNFNGHKLYSILDDRDSCYLKVMGKTYEQHLKDQEEMRKHDEEVEKRLAEENEKNIEAWKERGYALVPEELQGEWYRCVVARATDVSRGYELNTALDIMELLSQGGACKDAYEMLENHSYTGWKYSVTMSVIKKFSPRGAEFEEYCNNCKERE